MNLRQKQKHCRTCNRATLHEKHFFETGWGCLLTILTGGLFIPVWLLIDVSRSLSRWTCQRCGAKN